MLVAAELQQEVNYVLVIAIIIIVAVLLFTSRSFAEVLVFLIIFGVSALLNMGTNFWLGKISFISNSVAIILQLALAIDYAIILSHRFAEEKSSGADAHNAMVAALSKAIPEISGSSLTTIAGLLALTTMSLTLGADLGIVLAKGILCSIVTVFLLMPGMMLFFSKPIDKTTHRSFVPRIPFLGKLDVKLRYVIPALFLVLCIFGSVLSFSTEYVYSENSIDTDRPTSQMIALNEIEKVFGKTNIFVVLVPAGDYETALGVIEIMEREELVNSSQGICNVEVTSNNQTYYLTEGLNYKDFASFLSMNEDTAQMIYRTYAFFSKDNTQDGLSEIAVYSANPDIYRASLLELFDCAFSHDDFISAALYNDADTLDVYTDLREEIQDAEKQLCGVNYDRIVFNIDSEVESAETFAFIERLLTEVKGYCPQAVFAGDSMSSYDLNESFVSDNLKVSLLTVTFVFIILLFTFSSWGVPIPLVLTIQGAIFINFSYYVLVGSNLYFFVYLIVSSIQMGATIDYAIVITNRFNDLKTKMDKKTAIIETLNGAFPTILTSGTIMAVAGFLIGSLVSNQLIATMGICLGRGVLISIAGVLLVLPTLLYLFERPLGKTHFKKRQRKTSDNGGKFAPVKWLENVLEKSKELEDTVNDEQNVEE